MFNIKITKSCCNSYQFVTTFLIFCQHNKTVVCVRVRVAAAYCQQIFNSSTFHNIFAEFNSFQMFLNWIPIKSQVIIVITCF